MVTLPSILPIQVGCDNSTTELPADSFAIVDSASCRLEQCKSRQLKRHALLEQVAALIDHRGPLVYDSDSRSASLSVSKKRRFKGFPQDSFDETVYRKRVILPWITRLKVPTFSRRLRNRIKHLMAGGNTLSYPNQSQPVNSSQLSGDAVFSSFTSAPLPNTPATKNEPGSSLSKGLSPSAAGADDLSLQSYTGSSTFLKGTQSANPHNDYCQHFVDTGERPQNFIRDTGLRNRFEEYPKLRELIRLKDEHISSRATPPMYLQADLRTFDLAGLQSKFDVVLIEPPLEEYHRMNGAVFDQTWTWDEIEALEIERIVAPRAFVWIWCGTGEGLDCARRCLRKWGFRRCEDICWIKTNQGKLGHEALEPGAVFQRTKEHCLMGIHGTVRRSTDGDFIHANVDIDLIIEDAPKYGGYAAKDKPTEIFHIIEHFCLGRRRLHLFGRDSTLRAGWLTVGNELSASNFDARLYAANFTKEPNGWLLGSSEDIERLRPKSPPPRHSTVATTITSVTSIPSTCSSLVGKLLPTFSAGPFMSTDGLSKNLQQPVSVPSVFHSNMLRPHSFSGRRNDSSALQPSLLGLPTHMLMGGRNMSGSLDRSNNTISGISTSAQNRIAVHPFHLPQSRLFSSIPPSLTMALAAANTPNFLAGSPMTNVSSISGLRAPSPHQNQLHGNLHASGGKFTPAMFAALSAAAAAAGLGPFGSAPFRGAGGGD